MAIKFRMTNLWVVLSLAVVSACSDPSEESRKIFADQGSWKTVVLHKDWSMDIPPGFEHVERTGADTKSGSIISKKENLEINYDIGAFSGPYANPARKRKYIWYRSGTRHDAKYDYALDYEKDGKIFFITYPDMGPANFYMRGNLDEKSIDRVMAIVLTFKKRPPEEPMHK